jgi:transposase
MVKTFYRLMTVRDKKNILLCRYGSLHSFCQITSSIADVARAVRVPYATVNSFIFRHRRLGNALVRDHPGNRVPAPIGNSDVERLLLSDEYLRKWGGLTMRQRAEKVRQRFGVRVDHQRLRAFYRRNQVTYRKSYQVYQGEVIDPVGIARLRHQYATKLQYLLDQDADVIYMDETAFNSWQKIDRTWFHRQKKFTVPRSSPRGSGFTLYRAIGRSLRHGRAFMIGTSMNNADTRAFFRLLAREKRDPDAKPFVVMDNHVSHRSQKTQPTIRRHFTPFRQPKYSCQFNSIETLWAKIKAQYNRRVTRLALKRNYTVDDCKALVRLICDELQPGLVDNVLRANQAFIDQFKLYAGPVG